MSTKSVMLIKLTSEDGRRKYTFAVPRGENDTYITIERNMISDTMSMYDPIDNLSAKHIFLMLALIEKNEQRTLNDMPALQERIK